MPPEPIAHVALGIAAAFLVTFGAFTALRYLRADSETRASLRLASRIRRTWRRSAPMLGLAVADRTPTTGAQLIAKRGRRPEPRTRIPAITTRADRTGVSIRMKTVAGIGVDEVTQQARHLADLWGCARVSVVPDGPGRLLVRAVRFDPLAAPTRYRPGLTAPATLRVWPMGEDEYAKPVAAALSNVPGIAVAGLPGYGKTSLINSLIGRFAPSDAVQFAVADGKAETADAGDYAEIAPRLFAFVGDDLAEANKLFTRLVKLRRDRFAAMKRALGTANLWDVNPSAAWPLVILVIDEAHTFFSQPKGSDKRSRELAALAAENARLVDDLIRKGRSVGFVTIVVTQKPTGDAIPTSIRDNCGIRVSFAQTTQEAAVAALGDDIRQWPDANPVSLQDPAYVGVASMRIQGQEGFTRVRMPEVTPSDTAEVATATAHLTVDPAALLPHRDGPGPADFTKAA
ncbi:FtsK/SpoIIIE domain-containing protein [Streptomyces guryensis]|uniref:Cell division protein FtsK n=1 Tax=Streptomyces guryensis TaxID=2886947 RepID=A0A9Q3VVQ8_9ACTN|nr:FtsK/SpoIIIE domain-containing protein [Streptomyces guryensis]MCD9878243.1 cell division protein FtsK [Streptomyces guryensis]